MLRRRAVPVPYRLGHPVWVEEPAFDMARHVHWRVAPGAGTDRDLAAIVAEIAAVRCRGTGPCGTSPWSRAWPGDHVAFVMKLHHSLADGGAAVALLENAFVLDDAEAYVEPARPEPMPTDGVLVRQALANGSRRAAGRASPDGPHRLGAGRGPPGPEGPRRRAARLLLGAAHPVQRVAGARAHLRHDRPRPAGRC